MTERSPHEIIAQAGTAARELELTEHIFDGLRAAMLEKIATSPFEAANLRERLYQGVSSLDAVRKALRNCVSAGAVAEHRINFEVELAKAGFTRPD